MKSCLSLSFYLKFYYVSIGNTLTFITDTFTTDEGQCIHGKFCHNKLEVTIYNNQCLKFDWLIDWGKQSMLTLQWLDQLLVVNHHTCPFEFHLNYQETDWRPWNNQHILSNNGKLQFTKYWLLFMGVYQTPKTLNLKDNTSTIETINLALLVQYHQEDHIAKASMLC